MTAVTPSMPTQDEVRERLRRVPEPCAILLREKDDIVSMGLVEHIECGNGHVRVELVLTDASCVHFAGLQRFIADVLADLPGVGTVEVTASRTKLWTPDRRTPRS